MAVEKEQTSDEQSKTGDERIAPSSSGEKSLGDSPIDSLLAQWGEGHNALRHLLGLYRGEMHDEVCREGLSGDADDAVQEFIMVMLARLPPPNDSLALWLKTGAKNKAIDRGRRAKAQRSRMGGAERSLGESGGLTVGEGLAQSERIRERARELKELKELTLEYFLALPEPQQRVLVGDIVGMTNDEIADWVEKKTGAVYTNRSRALQKLRKELGEFLRKVWKGQRS